MEGSLPESQHGGTQMEKIAYGRDGTWDTVAKQVWAWRYDGRMDISLRFIYILTQNRTRWKGLGDKNLQGDLEYRTSEGHTACILLSGFKVQLTDMIHCK